MTSLSILKKKKQEKIILTLDKLGFATRSQIQELHDLKSNRNANWFLSGMKEYLNSFRIKEYSTIYYANKKGLELIGSTKEPLVKNLQVEHYLMRTDIYIYYNAPEDFVIEKRIPYHTYNELGQGIVQKKENIVVPDAHFTVNGLHHFLEVDNLQNMKKNEQKIQNYKDVVRAVKETYKQTPTIIFYTSSENRKKKLDEWCDRAGLHYQVLTRNDI